MTQEILEDENGLPFLSKAESVITESGLRLNHGNTRYMNQKMWKKFLSMIYNIVKWRRNKHLYPKTIWRPILLMVIIYMRCCVDGELTKKFNEYYHYTSVIKDEKKTVDANTHENFKNYWGLSNGDEYWHTKYPLLLVLAGDGFPIPKSDNDVDSGCVGLNKCHVFSNSHLQQTLYIAILFMISGLNEHDSRVSEVYHKCSNDLGIKGGFSIYSEKAKCFLLIEWFRADMGDWPWVSTVVLKCLPHSSNYPFIYWIEHIGKKFVHVKKSRKEVVEAIQAGIKPEHMPWNLKIESIGEFENFYCLATEYHWQQEANEIETYMNNLKNFNNKTYKQKHKKRATFATNNGYSILYDMPLWLVQYLLDVTHGIIRSTWMQVAALAVTCWCPFRFTLEQFETVFAHSCMFADLYWFVNQCF